MGNDLWSMVYDLWSEAHVRSRVPVAPKGCPTLRYRGSRLGFQVQDFSVAGLGFRVLGFGFRDSGAGFLVSGVWFRRREPRARGPEGVPHLRNQEGSMRLPRKRESELPWRKAGPLKLS